jgi:hypothetical protein
LDIKDDELLKYLGDEGVYIVEKYVLGLYGNEIRPYEEFLLNIFKKIKVTSIECLNNFFIYKKNDVIYFNYDEKNKSLYYYSKIYSILKSKYNLNEIISNCFLLSFSIAALVENLYFLATASKIALYQAWLVAVLDQGLIAPSAKDNFLLGITKSESTVSLVPSPVHFGQAP